MRGNPAGRQRKIHEDRCGITIGKMPNRAYLAQIAITRAWMGMAG